jgi:hypothetical protein
MKALPHHAASVLAIASFALLAGCASVHQEEAPAPLGAVATAGSDAPASITGSRIPSRRTEKMVSQVGGQDYKDNKSALPAPLQSN